MVTQLTTPTAPQGWSCPKCGRVWSPIMTQCGTCNAGLPAFPGIPGRPTSPYATLAEIKHDPEATWCGCLACIAVRREATE